MWKGSVVTGQKIIPISLLNMGLFLFNESIVFGYEMSVNESNLVYMLDGSTCHGGMMVMEKRWGKSRQNE